MEIKHEITINKGYFPIGYIYWGDRRVGRCGVQLNKVKNHKNDQTISYSFSYKTFGSAYIPDLFRFDVVILDITQRNTALPDTEMHFHKKYSLSLWIIMIFKSTYVEDSKRNCTIVFNMFKFFLLLSSSIVFWGWSVVCPQLFQLN